MKNLNKIVFKKGTYGAIILFFVFSYFFSNQLIVNSQNLFSDLFQADDSENAGKFIDDPLRFIDNNDNSITDISTKLSWTKCDYGLAGQYCDIPNYCGFDGTAQDSWGLKTEGAPFCDSNLGTTKSVNLGCTMQSDTKGRRDWTDDSGVAACANSVLCKDGSFITVDWRTDIMHNPNEYPSTVDKMQTFMADVPMSAKERACENHGGISKSKWYLPSLEELKSLYDENEENGLSSNRFPNSVGTYQSNTVYDLEKMSIANFTFSQNGGEESSCVISGPVKCVSEEVGQLEKDESVINPPVLKSENNKLLAVTPADFDDIGKIISDLGIPYDEINDVDIESLDVLRKYNAVFINCSGSIYNTEKAAGVIREYVNLGGSVYASDWASDLIQQAFPEMIFFSEDIDTGTAEVLAKVANPGLVTILGKKSVMIDFDMGSWKLIDHVGSNTDIYITGPIISESGTPMGNKPYAVSFQYGDGNVLYTSFHNEAQVEEDVKKILEWFVMKNGYWQIISEAREMSEGKNNLLEIVDAVKPDSKKEYSIKTNNGKKMEILIYPTEGFPVDFILKDDNNAKIIDEKNIDTPFLKEILTNSQAYKLIIEPATKSQELSPFVISVNGDKDAIAGPSFMEKVSDFIETNKLKIANLTVKFVDKTKAVATIFVVVHICLYPIYDKFILKNANPILNRIYDASKSIIKIISDGFKNIINVLKTKK